MLGHLWKVNVIVFICKLQNEYYWCKIVEMKRKSRSFGHKNLNRVKINEQILRNDNSVLCWWRWLLQAVVNSFKLPLAHIFGWANKSEALCMFRYCFLSPWQIFFFSWCVFYCLIVKYALDHSGFFNTSNTEIGSPSFSASNC